MDNGMKERQRRENAPKLIPSYGLGGSVRSDMFCVCPSLVSISVDSSASDVNIIRAGLTMVPNVPWHRALRRKGPPRATKKIFRLFNCHLYRELFD